MANPSFEEIISCPNNYGQIDSIIGWSTLLNGGGGTPDFFHSCSFSVAVGVPSNLFYSFQYPHSGNSYIGIEVADSYSNPLWEYIQSKLKKSLSTGQLYCIKYYVSKLDYTNAYIETLGAYLDNGNVSAIPPYGLATVTPQVYNISQPLNDTVNWMKIEGSFVATGYENYITIGNFLLI